VNAREPQVVPKILHPVTQGLSLGGALEFAIEHYLFTVMRRKKIGGLSRIAIADCQLFMRIKALAEILGEHNVAPALVHLYDQK
jgi:hypothetical protein